MTSTIDGLRLRKTLGRDRFLVPERFGPDGWRLIGRNGIESVIVTAWAHERVPWVHASWRGPGRTPTYEEMMLLHHAVWRDIGWSYQMHPPADRHININEFVLHLWGRLDGEPVMPDFGSLFGSI